MCVCGGQAKIMTWPQLTSEKSMNWQLDALKCKGMLDGSLYSEFPYLFAVGEHMF